MPASQRRYGLLNSRLRAFTRALPQIKSAEARVAERAWSAARRLRELLPILQLDGPTVEKLSDRLRRVVRRLSEVRQFEAMLTILDELDRTDRRARHARNRVRDDVQRLAERARAELYRRKIGNDVRRASRKLTDILQTLRTTDDSRKALRDMEWAARARVARRATNLKDAINAAGSVYLPTRVDAVRSSLRKLRYGAELAAELSESIKVADVRTLSRVEHLLTQLNDGQLLIDRARHVQGSLATPDLKAWRDLDGLITSLENRCRVLHARYVSDRVALVAMCDRLLTRTPGERSARRKVG